MKLVIELALPHGEEQNKTKYTGKNFFNFQNLAKKVTFQ